MKGWAQWYAQALGWSVFPLIPAGKIPFPETRGHRDATRNPAAVGLIWDANPQANIGLHLADNGLMAFDVDAHKGGLDSFNRLQAEHGPITSPLVCHSPSGGFHLYYRVPAGRKPKGRPAEGIDGKYNGYVLLYPSVAASKVDGQLKHYTWGHDLSGPWPQIPEAPEWMLIPARPEGEHTRARVGDLADVPKIREALGKLPVSDFMAWITAGMALKSWQEVTEGAEDTGFALWQEWSETDPNPDHHRDGELEYRWSTFLRGAGDAHAAGLGSLFHAAGMTREQTELPPEVAFAQPGELPPGLRPVVWTDAPQVPGYDAPADETVELLAGKFAASLQQPTVERVNWWTGGNCEATARILGLCNVPLTDELRAHIAHDAATRTTCRGQLADSPDRRDTRERTGLSGVLEVGNGEISSAVVAVQNLYLPSWPEVFQRAGKLVRVTEEGRILEHNVPSLSQLLETRLNVIKSKKPAEVPEALARRVLDLQHYPGVPELRGAVRLPFARPDGSPVEEVGFDQSTGFYLAPHSVPAARVLSSGEEVRAALDAVWQPFSLFPWQDEVAKAAMWSAILTAVARMSLPTAPAFVMDAQTAGTGKTLLGECLMLAAGAGTDARHFPRDEAELEKRVLAWLAECTPGLLLDNAKGTIRDDSTICSILTSERYTGRILGASQGRTVDNRALWVFTGNNLIIRGDMVRRVVKCTLHSPANADRRQFPFDPRDLLGAEWRANALSLLMTYGAAGMPQQAASGMASYQAWDRLVRGACQWYGLGDPLAAIDRAREEDPQVVEAKAMAHAWNARFADEAILLREIPNRPMAGEIAAAWAEAYGAICEADGRDNPKKLGYWLRGMKGVNIDGFQFEFVMDANLHTRRWRLVKIA